MRARTLFVLTSLAAMGCTSIIGVRDIFLDENAANGNEDGGASSSGNGSSGAASSSGSSGDAGGDATVNCNADFQTDPLHCGRCGHDCLGGACLAGMCQPKILASGLVNPNTLALDAMNVYTTTYGDGRVMRVAKDGSTTTPLATGQTKASGVAVDGNVLYWANADFSADDAGTYKGGVFKCTLPACTDQALVTAADIPNNISVAGGVIYISVRNDAQIRSVKPNGTQNTLIATTNQPFGIACDTNHCYYTSAQPNLYRALADGGRGETAVGALDSDFLGYVAVDAERYYWAYTQENTGKGKVFSGLKNDIAGAKIEYGPNATGSVGVAVDATNVYWTNGGTFTGNTSNADGELLTCPKAGCPATGPTKLADKLPNPWGVAVDDVAVYWVEYTNDNQQTGAVKKVAKP